MKTLTITEAKKNLGRGNRDLRFIFQDRTDELYVSFVGNHDDIRTLLRRGAYR